MPNFRTMLLFYIFLLSTYPIACYSQNSAISSEQHPITIVIISNTTSFLDQNLSMCLKQKYLNFNILYVADGLENWQYNAIEHWISCNDHAQRITLVRNQTKKGTLASLWSLVHTVIDDKNIVVYLKPNDWFTSNMVLLTINNEYLTNNAWMTYSQYYSFPSMQQGKNCQPSLNTLLAHNWRQGALLQKYSRCCSFYASLFKAIKVDDLLYKNNFFIAAADNAFIFPLMEQAGKHVRYIETPLYVYNEQAYQNELQQYLYLCLAAARYLQQKKPYEPLCSLPLAHTKEQTADLIVFSFNRPLQLYALLESLEKHASHIGYISVLYRVSNEQFAHGYTLVKEQFPSVEFVLQQASPENDFKSKLMNLLEKSGDYIAFAVDDIIIKEPFDVAECIDWLEKTHAYGFYLRLGTNIKKCYFDAAPINPDTSINPYYILNNRICVWQFIHGSHDWKYPNTLDMTIYRKKDIVPTITQLDFKTPNMCEGLWHGTSDYAGTGVCFLKSNVVNLPLNMVQDDMFFNPRTIDIPVEKLLLFFLEGLKLDIDSLLHINNPSAHIDFIPPMIIRELSKKEN